MSLNNNLPCTKSIPVELFSSFTKLVAKHFISVLLYFVDAVAVKFLIRVLGHESSGIACCMKPLSITLCLSANVSFTTNNSNLESSTTQLNSTLVPLRTVTLSS